MPIPDATRDQLLMAIETFDSNLRNASEWQNWAIEHDGRLYPVKQIISLATFTSLDSFKGGAVANDYVRQKGFNVVELHPAGTSFDKLIERFRKQYGSFTSPLYIDDERNYKLEAAAKLTERLAPDVLRDLIDSGRFDEASTEIKRAMQGNNLLNQWDGRPVRDAPAEPLARSLYELVYGDGPFDARFDAWVALLAESKPGCWPAATYFLMLHDPARHILVKPEPYRALLATLDEEVEWNPHPSAERYAALRELAERLLEQLRPLGARDMIDVQSFIWIVREELSLIPTARSLDSEHEAIYAAAERFVDAALRQDGSLFTPGRPIWSVENIAELLRRLATADRSRSSFLAKLEQQLSGAPAELYQLAAEALFVHMLLASSDSISAGKKRDRISTVLRWSPEPVEIPADLDAALDRGLAAMGVAFGTFKPDQLAFLLTFVQRLKELAPGERERLLDDPWAFKDMLFAIPIAKAFIQREALLHIVHPDVFERIVSRQHKAQIAEQLGKGLSATDVDVRMRQIRDTLTRQLRRHFHFYEPEIKQQWDGTGGIHGPLSDSLGVYLRPYARLALRLTQPSYSAEDIAELVGTISPPIAVLSTEPNPENLATDLELLRLVEEIEDGRYRRWPHLADGTEELLLRYAALTLLLPVEGADDAYELPILRVPRDGEAHPAAAWPGGEPLLRWYEEAGLVERAGNGWRLKDDALDPVAGETPTARAINTFLGHLRAVWSAAASDRDVVDESLPVLAKEALDERVAEIQRELLIDRGTILRIYRSLIAGRNVILSGPPGTGKTHLARILPRILWRGEAPGRLALQARPEVPPTDPPLSTPVQRDGYDTDVVTATEDWGVRHVIGGIVPQIRRQGDDSTLVYGVRHGCVTRSVLQNYGGDGEAMPDADTFIRRPIERDGGSYRGRWLVIDEFTRAPIDAAFGSLLTTLGGQRYAELDVPTDDGSTRRVRVPRDFRLIGTLNSFDRHFLNQISEAMKRRFTFVDILPPGRGLADRERAMAIFRALLRLRYSGLAEVAADELAGTASLSGWITVRREETPGDEQTRVRYTLSFADTDAEAAVLGFWRLFEAIRVYRQLGTAQAEAVYATLFAGRAIGMRWPEALDAALADELADQLQVLARDEQRVLLALLEHAGSSGNFANRVRNILGDLPSQRQRAHLSLLGHTDELSTLQPEQLAALFHLGTALPLPPDGLFARRLAGLINERGL